MIKKNIPFSYCWQFSEAHLNGDDKVSTLKRAITAGNVGLVRELLDSGKCLYS